MVQRVSLTITTNNIEDLINDMKSAMVYMSNTISMMNGLVDEIETAYRSGRVVDVSPEDVKKMQEDAAENYKRLESAREAAKRSVQTPPEGIGLMPDPEGKAHPAPQGIIPTDPRVRTGPMPSKKRNR